MTAPPIPVVFIHGLWIHSDAWQPWVELYRSAGLDAGARLRLVWVRATGLVGETGVATQLAFGPPPAPWREAERTVDQIGRAHV